MDLGTVWRISRPRRFVPDALDMQGTVPGELRLWHLTTTGHWVGYVEFAVKAGDQGGVRVSQWVMEDALKPRTDSPARK
ncbi:hypothetical protein FXN61_00630 [Lentzea sp. PSKA42]|uniref:Uncharacterized protein n=1 Tax=Lentzea indica TaxID=2604800 RepID=A0ABX1F9I2_9PSEU|nr:hypothetical protein [Lentzea indica]NKE55411.1 hypothetical protein [Lentzea indica]